MFLAKKFIGGIIDLLVFLFIYLFFIFLQPPPRRPFNFAESHESEEEKQFRKVFQQLAGDDMEVSPNELMNILNKVVGKRNLRTDGFSIESCRSMVAVMDSDSTGKLGFHEFKYLWNNIKRWQVSYSQSEELPPAFKLQLYKLIIRRYSDEHGDMDFDNFIGCLVRLDAMCSESLPTLDKDNNGSIDLDIKEVKHFIYSISEEVWFLSAEKGEKTSKIHIVSHSAALFHQI
uniref:Calpain, small subunit 1 b n=1 Tax=Amphiprion percula TaxID=161767 RepID=A0A3P8U4E6_AMPPE